jgi:hypothetical protein
MSGVKHIGMHRTLQVNSTKARWGKTMEAVEFRNETRKEFGASEIQSWQRGKKKAQFHFSFIPIREQNL